MEQRKDTNENGDDLFKASHLIILITYTILSIILIGEAFLLSWEKWPLVIIAGGVIFSWILHIREEASERTRIWVYSLLMMFTFFFYGYHTTSTFDTVGVMAAVMMLYTLTGIKPLISFLQIVYYITFTYALFNLIAEGQKLDSLFVSRAFLHYALITTIGFIARYTIDKWKSVMEHTKEEIVDLKDATERLNDFLANVSHEIRTPINAVIGLTGICIENEKNEKKLENLYAVRDAGRRVADQISDILDYSEIDRNKLANNYENYMLSSVLNDIVNEIRGEIPDDVELIIDVDPDIPAVMYTDISKLKKIIRHLTGNGLKYTVEGGVYVRISSEKQKYGVNLLIEVTDTGIGMSAEEVERVSERFYQVDSGRSRKGGGLGIGMSIVEGFVSSLGGFMIIDSIQGEGTTVRVSIPQEVIDPEPCMSVSHRESLCLGAFLHFDKYDNPSVREYYNVMVRNIVRGMKVKMHRVDNADDLKRLTGSVDLTHLFVAQEEYETAPDQIEELAKKMIVAVIAHKGFELKKGSKARIMEKPFYCFPVVSVLNMTIDDINDNERETLYCPGVKALVVDDEPMNLTVAKNILGRYGIDVTYAYSGEESIKISKDNNFDIIFMDHMMPGMDGVEAMKRIRSDRSRGDVPIVALTANAVSSAKEMFLSVGFDGFIAKPIELSTLERVLKRVLPKSAFSDEDRVTDPENEEKSKTDQNDGFAALSDLDIDAQTGLDYCQNDNEFYLQLLADYSRNSKTKISDMEGYFNEKDYDSYKIRVHAIKSTSKMIGAADLSEKAKALEKAAGDKDEQYINENHPGFMEEYSRVLEGIISFLPEDVKKSVFGPEEGSKEDDDILEFSPEEEKDDEVIEFSPKEDEQ